MSVNNIKGFNRLSPWGKVIFTRGYAQHRKQVGNTQDWTAIEVKEHRHHIEIHFKNGESINYRDELEISNMNREIREKDTKIKCKHCGEEIVFRTTNKNFKKMPCNPNTKQYWAKEKARGKIITPEGNVVSCDFEGDEDKKTGYGYEPHFATCKGRM